MAARRSEDCEDCQRAGTPTAPWVQTVVATSASGPASEASKVSRTPESATSPAVIEAVETGTFDLLILDGEATPVGGLGLCRQLKSEIYRCPPVVVLTGRPQDGWLAAWSQADMAVPHPLDPLALSTAVAQVARERATRADD